MLLHFANPGLLFGALAAIVPFLIHWFLRPKPRRVRFPALSLLSGALASGRRAQRLRDIWLLVLRSLLFAAAAVVLAGPTCAPSGSVADGDAVACIMLMDDSCSTQYQLDQQERLVDRIRRRADAFVRAAGDWPAQSALGLLWAGPQRATVELTADFAAAADALRKSADAPPHAAALGAALREAGARLRTARQPVRRLVVFTDMAAHAWRDASTGVLGGVENLTVQVVAPVDEMRSNLAVTAAAIAGRVHSETGAVPLAASVRAGGLGVHCTVTARRAGETLDRQGPLDLAANSAADLTLLLPPVAAGMHAVTLAIQPDDRLEFDQARYAVYQTGPRPLVWLLAPAARDDSDVTTLVLANLLAPESLSPRQQAVTLLRRGPDELAEQPAPAWQPALASGPAASDVPRLIAIPAGVPLSDTERAVVLAQAEQGASLLLVAGGDSERCDWPGLRLLFSAEPPRVERLDAVTSIAWESQSPLARGLGAAELARAAVRRRVVLDEPAEDVIVHARYADGRPALLSKRVGRGQALLFATGPDPQWSDLGIRAAGLLSLLFDLIERAQPAADRVGGFLVGDEPHEAFASLPREAAVAVTLVESAAAATQPAGGAAGANTVRLKDGRALSPWPTEKPGVYAIQSIGQRELLALYAVNWPPEESDLTPIGLARLQALLGTENVSLDTRSWSAAAPPASWAGRIGVRDPAGLWALLLLGLVLGEVWLAARGAAREVV